MNRISRRKSTGAVSNRTLNRLIAGLIALIAIGLPAIAITYYADRHVDAGLSMAQRAVSAAEESVRSDPNRLSNRVALAAAYARADRARDAVTQYDLVLASEPQNRTALIGRGDAHRALNELDAATSDYQAFVDLAGDEEMARVDRLLEAAYFGLAVIAFEQDRPRDAATNLADALIIDRTDADALDLMGRALIRINDLPAAVDALRDAIALVPTGWCDPYAHLNEAYVAQGDAAGADYAAGMVALCEKRTDDAEQLLQPLADGAYARDALVGLALVAEDRGDLATAADLYNRVYAMNPADFAAITGLARVGTPVASPATAEDQ